MVPGAAWVPSSVWVGGPLPVRGPLVGPLTAPAELLPSPKSIVAAYSLAVALASGSVNVATGPLKLAPSVALKVFPLAEMAASVVAETQCLTAVACCLLPLAVKLATMVSSPAPLVSGYMNVTLPLASVTHVAGEHVT